MTLSHIRGRDEYFYRNCRDLDLLSVRSGRDIYVYRRDARSKTKDVGVMKRRSFLKSIAALVPVAAFSPAALLTNPPLRDATSRMAEYQRKMREGTMSVNDVRRAEGLAPIFSIESGDIRSVCVTQAGTVERAELAARHRPRRDGPFLANGQAAHKAVFIENGQPTCRVTR